MNRVILPVMFDPDVDGVSDVVGGGVTIAVPLPYIRPNCGRCRRWPFALGMCREHHREWWNTQIEARP